MKPALIQIIEENIFANYKGLTQLLEGRFNENEETAWYNTGFKSHFRFNGVVRTKTRTEALSRVVDPVLNEFLSQELPFFWVDWQDAGTPGLGDYLKSKDINFIYVPQTPAMFCELKKLPEQIHPQEVEIVHVQSPQQQTDWLNVMMEGFQEPEAARPEIQKYISRSVAQPKPLFDHFLTYWQGKPCATSSLLHANLASGIYNVTTLPSFRKRGLGRAATLYAMQFAKKVGYRTCILFATPSGLPVYKKLGFEIVSSADLYIWNGIEKKSF